MIRIMAIAAAALAGIAMLAASDGTARAGPHVETIHDVTVEAGFRHVDEANPCLVTIVQVLAARTVYQAPPGSPEVTFPVDLTIRIQDTCNVDEFGAPLTLFDAAGFGELSEGQLQVSPQRDSATLDAVIPVHEGISDTHFDAAVDLTWVASGEPVSGNHPFRFTDPESPPGPFSFLLNAHENALFQEAVAGGSVSHGPTNYARGDSVFAYISANKNGTVMPLMGE